MSDQQTPDTTTDADGPDPQTFDLDSWLSGVIPTGKGFTIYQRGDLYDEYQDACDRYDLLTAGDTDEQGQDTPDEAPLSAPSEVSALAKRIADLERQLKPGAIHGKVRTANFDHQEQARRKARTKDDNGAPDLDLHEFYLQLAARVIVEPKLPVAGWRKVALAVGERQWQVVRDAIDASCEQSKGLNLDFSSRRSGRH